MMERLPFGSCCSWISRCCSWRSWWSFAGWAVGVGAVSDVGVVAQEGAGGVWYWMSGRRLVIRLCCIVLAVSAFCVTAYSYSLLPPSIFV